MLTLLASSCGEGSHRTDPPTTPGSSTTDPGRFNPDEKARLRALGYTGDADALEDGETAGVLLYDREKSAPGLNLITSSDDCSTQLIDMEGNLLHEWSHPDSFRWGNSTLLPNGDLLIAGRLERYPDDPEASRLARYLMLINWAGEIVWRKDIPAHHDVELRPDGKIATLTYEFRIVPDIDPEVPVRDDYILLATRAGEVLEKTSILDLLRAAPEVHQLESVEPREFDGALEVDIIHANVVEFMRHPQLVAKHPLYSSANLLLCLRHQDSIVIYDWERKKLLWSWGQGDLLGPHDATVLPTGNILVFDNGLGRGWSRILEMNPLTGEIVWQYRARRPRSFFTFTRGSNQRLSNGNTLIAESDRGRAFEVTKSGKKVWEFLNTKLTEKRRPVPIVRIRRYEGLDYEQLAERVAAGKLVMQD